MVGLYRVTVELVRSKCKVDVEASDYAQNRSKTRDYGPRACSVLSSGQGRGVFGTCWWLGDRLGGRLGVARRRVFHGGEKVGAGKGGSVSLVEKMRINNECTLYACPVHPPAPPHRHFWGSRPLVPSWLPTVATFCVVRVVDERNCQKWKSRLVDTSRRSHDLTQRAEQNAKLCW